MTGRDGHSKAASLGAAKSRRLKSRVRFTLLACSYALLSCALLAFIVVAGTLNSADQEGAPAQAQQDQTSSTTSASSSGSTGFGSLEVPETIGGAAFFSGDSASSGIDAAAVRSMPDARSGVAASASSDVDVDAVAGGAASAGDGEDFSWVTNAEFAKRDNQGKIELAAQMARADFKTSGILPSLTIAQFILESGWGSSSLAADDENYFGIKTHPESWTGSTWQGDSVDYETGEEYDGEQVRITDGFRVYDNAWQSFQDHSAYLANRSTDGTTRLYEGIVGETDVAACCDILARGGYATGSSYKSSIMALVDTYDLTRYDD